MRLKLKKKNVIVASIILLLIIIEIINPFRSIAISKLKKMNYSQESSNYIIDYGLKRKIFDIKYNEFIDKNIVNKNFDPDNYEYYKMLNYYKKSNDITLVNKLIAKKYTGLEIEGILKTGTIESIQEFLQKDKQENILNFLSYDFAILSKLDEYVEYKELNVCTYEQAIIHINLGLDREYYTDISETEKFSYTMLVNKYNRLSEDFKSEELIEFPKAYCINNKCEFGNKKMVNAFNDMAVALLKEENLNIYARSAYRTYEYQTKTYNEYMKLYGEKYTLSNVAKPGFSEHQTGLCVDIKAGSSNTFKGTKESKWLKANAYKYGFILRYEDSKQSITGFKGEEWHYRYVGLEVSKYIYEHKITFEEYYIRFLNK